MAKNADILIIDDDRDLVNAMQLVLESRSHRVRTAFNGADGMIEIQAHKPDLIILDVMMTTDTEGFDLACKLRNQIIHRDIPILMVTSFPQKMASEGPEKFQHILGEDWPVTQFMEKPVDTEELLAVVERLLADAI
jgi:two-component system alkaline phosphatase synthesis response regulator PhoP